MSTKVQIGGRASKGGEQGINGFWYEGGQYMPSSEMPPKCRRRIAAYGKRKQQVAPYVWAVPPTANHSALFARYAALVIFDPATGEYAVIDNAQAIAYYRTTRAALQTIADRLNAGEQWEERERNADGWFI